MLGIHEFWLFILSGLLLNITPGPDTAYILGRSMQLGWRGGAAAAIGISTGCLVHVFAAAIGLSALLMASSAAFAVLKLAGAAYLLFTGIQMLLSRPKPPADIAAPGGETSLSRVFWQGALTNVLNPKVACSSSPSCNSSRRIRRTRRCLPAVGAVFITARCGVSGWRRLRQGSVRIRRSAGLMAWISRVLGGLFVYLELSRADAGGAR
jgi:threonine/homoserine/homoserine lactone efflux protein